MSSDSSKVLYGEHGNDSGLQTKPNARIGCSEAGYGFENGEQSSDDDEEGDADVYGECSLGARWLLEELV